MFILMCLALLNAACGDKEGDGVKTIPASVTMITQKYYPTAEADVPYWSSTDRAGILLVDEAEPEIYSVKPIAAYQSEASFYLTMQAASPVATVVGFYPSYIGGTLRCGNGIVATTLATEQTPNAVAPVFVGSASGNLSSLEGCSINLKHLYCTVAILVAKSDKRLKKVTFSAAGGVGIAGAVTYTAATGAVIGTDSSISATFAEAVDCSAGVTVYISAVPANLVAGYTVTLTTDTGESVEKSVTEPLTLARASIESVEAPALGYTSGTNPDPDPDPDTPGVDTPEEPVGDTYLYFCGDNMVYKVNATQVSNGGSYKGNTTWSYNVSSISSTLGGTSYATRLDECKPVDGGTKLLLTSSRGWCVLLRISDKKVLFYTNKADNAHSAELVGDNVVVACSTGSDGNNNRLQVYDVDQNNKVISYVDLTDAHGVTWNEKYQRLYAIGGNQLVTYSLENWGTSSAKLKEVGRRTTTYGGLHDLTLVDDETLLLGGNHAWLFTIGTGALRELTLFNNSTKLKSINYNAKTGEVWYTDATVQEDSELSWATHTIRYASSAATATPETKTIKVSDISMYKVRVAAWGK